MRWSRQSGQGGMPPICSMASAEPTPMALSAATANPMARMERANRPPPATASDDIACNDESTHENNRNRRRYQFQPFLDEASHRFAIVMEQSGDKKEAARPRNHGQHDEPGEIIASKTAGDSHDFVRDGCQPLDQDDPG